MIAVILSEEGRHNFDKIFKHKKTKNMAKKQVESEVVDEVVHSTPVTVKTAIKKLPPVTQEEPVKRKPGRPKGSKNKPKDTQTQDTQ